VILAASLPREGAAIAPRFFGACPRHSILAFGPWPHHEGDHAAHASFPDHFGWRNSDCIVDARGSKADATTSRPRYRRAVQARQLGAKSFAIQ